MLHTTASLCGPPSPASQQPAAPTPSSSKSSNHALSVTWDDQQHELDELLREIFAPPDNDDDNAASAAAVTMDFDSDPAFDNDTDGDAASATFASPVGTKCTSKNDVMPTQQQQLASPTVSSSDERHSAFSGAGCSPGGVDMAAPGSPLSAKEKRQLEMRRKRNRESMRRVRQRKRIAYSELKQLLPGLEARLAHLRTLQTEHGRTVATASTLLVATDSSSQTGPAEAAGPAQTAALEQLRAVEQAFRRENAALEREIDRYEQAFVAVQDLLIEQQQQQQQTDTPLSAIATGPASVDHFAWTERAAHHLPQLADAAVRAFVQRSVCEVVAQIDAARALDESAHELLGWRVRRAVTGAWIQLAVSKHFAHEDVERVARKTWFVQSQSHAVNATMPQHHLMRVLRVVDESTLVCARNLFFPGDATNYCTVYLLMRVATPRGYVIAQRSLVPTDAAALANALGSACSYVNLFYGLILERPDEDSETDHMDDARPRGCTATFGGLAGNGTATYAQSSAKDLFVAMLRWESACVGPLYRLL